jgi:hypothetical protein
MNIYENKKSYTEYDFYPTDPTLSYISNRFVAFVGKFFQKHRVMLLGAGSKKNVPNRSSERKKSSIKTVLKHIASTHSRSSHEDPNMEIEKVFL